MSIISSLDVNLLLFPPCRNSAKDILYHVSPLYVPAVSDLTLIKNCITSSCYRSPTLRSQKGQQQEAEIADLEYTFFEEED